MNKVTKYQGTGSVKVTVIIILIYVILQTVLIVCNLGNWSVINFFVIFNILFGIFLIYILSGVLKGKRAINRELKYLKKINPYIYFRELPNYYGIGVITLLMNSTIENHKDIVAVILDLCARKYLKLEKQADKYVIKILKGLDDNLLGNEKYILRLVMNNDIKNVNYYQWFDYCLKDGIDLGLYSRYSHVNKIINPIINREKRIKSDNKIKLYICLILSCLIFLLMIGEGILNSVFSTIICFVVLYLFLTVIFGVIVFIREMIKEAKYAMNQNYIDQMNNKITRTDKGIEELHKIYSFKAFIKDFGYFVDKRAEEVVLWDRYLSYAHVFGLTKEIMESGYKELIDNSSFHIDSIDNIDLSNIEVK